MLFENVEFNRTIAFGAQRWVAWKTGVVETSSGFESSDQQWSRALHRYDVGLAVRTASLYEEVVDHFHSVRGRSRKFPFRDALDYRVGVDRGVLIDDDDSPTTGYQLAKRYGAGNNPYDRRITRPKTGTVAIYRLRGVTTTNITASCTITYGTSTAIGGFVSITPGVVLPGDVLSWSGEFFVPTRYDVDELPSVTVNRRPGGGDLLVQCDQLPLREVRE
jgi:uncharacterized protein (TIGR02217 family)